MGWTRNWIGEHSQARARVCSASACARSAECASGMYCVCLLCILYYAYIYLGSRPRLGQTEDVHANKHTARDRAATNANANANAKAAFNPGLGTHAITSFSFPFFPSPSRSARASPTPITLQTLYPACYSYSLQDSPRVAAQAPELSWLWSSSEWGPAELRDQSPGTSCGSRLACLCSHAVLLLVRSACLPLLPLPPGCWTTFCSGGT